MKLKLISTTEYAEREGISRVATLKRIKVGKVNAKKVGRNYVIFEKYENKNQRTNLER